MGKIRVKMLGDEQAEEKKKQEHKEKREAKKTAKVAGMGGGERTVMVGPTLEELESEQKTSGTEPSADGEKKTSSKARVKHPKGKQYLGNTALIDKNNSLYPLSKAIDLLAQFKKSKFDETVELHVNVKEKGVAGTVALPHGTGKKLRIVVADDAVIENVAKGKIDFDVLVAQPQMMPKLAKVAKILGPRGLMPNPKAGTITDKPEEVIKKLSAGQVNFKTEAAAPIIHMSIGKVSFGDEKLVENAKAALAAIGTTKITSATLKSTMSPGIKLQIASL